VTRIRTVNYMTQYTCLFKDVKRSKEVNESDRAKIGQWIRFYQIQYNVVPPSAPPPPTPTQKSASDEGIYCIGTKLRKRFLVSEFAHTSINAFSRETHIWLDGEVTQIRRVNSKTQYTCAFTDGQRKKVVNECNIAEIEQWIRGYVRRHSEDTSSAPPPHRRTLRTSPAPKPALVSLLVKGESYPTIQGTCSCYRENSIYTEFFLSYILLVSNPNSHVRIRSNTLRVCPTLLPTPAHTSALVFTFTSNFAYVVGKSSIATTSIHLRQRKSINVIDNCL
jgi:hypothetical protein